MMSGFTFKISISRFSQIFYLYQRTMILFLSEVIQLLSIRFLTFLISTYFYNIYIKSCIFLFNINQKDH